MMEKFKAFLKRKEIEFSWKRYFIDALGAMAQGLFCSLLIGTIIDTIGDLLVSGGAESFGNFLVEIGGFASAMSGPAMAIAIGYALKAPNLVLFSLAAVGSAANGLGGAGGPFLSLRHQQAAAAGEDVRRVPPPHTGQELSADARL
jgi:uncharacterized membrane protein